MPEKGAQLIITTMNTCKKLIKNWKLDLRSVKTVVIDEADDYWKTDIDKANLNEIIWHMDKDLNKKVDQKKQYPKIPTNDV